MVGPLQAGLGVVGPGSVIVGGYGWLAQVVGCDEERRKWKRRRRTDEGVYIVRLQP